MAQEEIKVVTVVDDAGSTKTIKELRKEIASYKDDLAGLTRGSKEYNSILEKLGNTQSHINDIMEDSKYAAMDLVDGFGVATKAASVLSAGMSAYNSIAALSGVENEELQKTFVKLQAGMALTQSLQAMAGGIKSANAAFKAFNATLLTNPIILVATAIIALVAGLAVLGNSLADQKSGVAQLNAEYDDHKKQIETTNTLRNREVDIMKAQGASTLEVIEWRRKQIAEDIENAKIEIKLREEEIKALEMKNKAWFSGERKRLKALKTIQGEESDRLNALLGELEQLNHEFSVETIRIETATADEKAKIQQKANEERIKAEEKLRNELLKQEEELNKATASLDADRQKRQKDLEKSLTSDQSRIDFINKEILANQALQESLNAVLNDPEASIKAKTEATNQLISAEQEQLSLEAELATTQEATTLNKIELEKLLKEAQGYGDMSQEEILEMKSLETQAEIERLWELAENTTLSYEERIEATNKLIAAQNELEKLGNEQIKLSQDAVKQEKVEADNKKKLEAQKISIVSGSLKQAADLMGEHTAAAKAMNVASAIMDTYSAANNALNSAPAPYNYILMAGTIAAGIANVTSILKTKVPGGDSGSASAPAIPSMPELKEPIQETHNNMTAYEEDNINQPQRVYVVESDITNVQNNVKTAVSESTF